MDFNHIEWLMSAFAALIAATLGILWTKADRAEKLAENNRTTILILSKQLDKTNQLTERLTSLEASVNVEIKNLSISIKRMESAILRIDHHGHNRPH